MWFSHRDSATLLAVDAVIEDRLAIRLAMAYERFVKQSTTRHVSPNSRAAGCYPSLLRPLIPPKRRPHGVCACTFLTSRYDCALYGRHFWTDGEMP